MTQATPTTTADTSSETAATALSATPATDTPQFTPDQRRAIYITTFVVGVVTIVAAPVVAAISAPAWLPALIGGLGSAASIVSATFGWRYLGK